MNTHVLNHVCQPLLNQIVTLEAFNTSTKAQALHQLCHSVDQIKLRAKAQGCCDEDVQEVSYALAALVDEQIPLRCPNLAGQWRSALLQELFGDNQGGSFFFDRLDRVLAEPQRSEVLNIFAICLALGFRGKFSDNGHQELAEIRAKVRGRIPEPLPNIDLQATRAPTESSAPSPLNPKRLIWSAALALCLVMIGVASMKHQLNRTSETLLLQLPSLLEPSKLS